MINTNNLIKSIFVVTSMIDILIAEEMGKASESSVIGKTIIPWDNSYAISLETGCKTRVYGKKFVCISQPYSKEMKGLFEDSAPYLVEMVKVRSVETGREYEIMFAEEWLVTEE